jgi:hypothetical protein
MVIMTKEEARNASHVWAANTKQPINRDAQIELMRTARDRHQSVINRLMKQVQNERNKE